MYFFSFVTGKVLTIQSPNYQNINAETMFFLILIKYGRVTINNHFYSTLDIIIINE